MKKIGGDMASKYQDMVKDIIDEKADKGGSAQQEKEQVEVEKNEARETKFRKLRADEIECRIGMIKENGLSLLLYKDARVDMNILDESVGAMNWKREHTRDNQNCIVSIWDSEKKEWVGKEDVGTESNTEAVKGLASDSFKRACVNWGIGRELYTAPFIWIKDADADIKNIGGKFRCYDSFKVAKLTYKDNGDIDGLAIMNMKTKQIVFTQMPASKKSEV